MSLTFNSPRCCPLVLALAFVGLGIDGPLAAAPRDEVKIPDPQNITLNTKDGVVLHCTYYAGGFQLKPGAKKEVTTIPGKDVVPVIMLHGWEGQRHDFDYTASYLQTLGHAVVVPDLRGHGDSLSRRLGGREVEINRDRMRSQDLYSMGQDVEAVKRFLLTKNNTGELNIEMLCVIGAEMGAIVALNWSDYDWRRPQLPAFKQGRDVKALVLLSPQKSVKGMTANNALKVPVIRTRLSMMVAVGQEDRKGYADAKSMFSRLESARPPLPSDQKQRLEKQDLFLVEPETSLSGTKLLTPRGLRINNDIARFIYLRLVSKKADFPWRERKNPLGSD